MTDFIRAHPGTRPESPSGFAKLDDVSACAYGRSVERGRFDRDELMEQMALSAAEVGRVEEVLCGLRLLQPMPGSPDVLVPVVPDVAAAELVGGAERQIHDLQHAVSDVRSQLMSLTPVFFEGRRRRNQAEALHVINDTARIEAIFDHLNQNCRDELLVVQPGGSSTAEELAVARRVSEAALARGARIRALYQHTARNDLATRAFLLKTAAQGAEIRTSDRLIDRLVVYDREVAFLIGDGAVGDGSAGEAAVGEAVVGQGTVRGGAVRDESPPVSAPPSPPRVSRATVVREPTVVSFLCTVFDHLWENASPFTRQQDGPAVSDGLKQSIIRLMAEGYKDEMVARRLGMSVRTCRRHIAEITDDLHARSRFQAGINVVLMGLVDSLNVLC